MNFIINNQLLFTNPLKQTVMKKKILLLSVVLAAFATLQASEDYWVDLNFTRDSVMWKNVFPPLVVAGYSSQCVPLANTDYLGYTCDGTFGKFAVSNYVYTPINAENINEQFIYAFRVTSNSATTHWTFPGTSDVGKIKVHVLCGNATADGEFTLQKYVSGEGAEAIWEEFDPVVKFVVPAHAFSTTSFVVEKTLNISVPTKLRFKGPAVKNVHFYAVTISKNTNSAVDANLMDKIRINLVGRSLEVKYNDMDFTASVYNLAGIQISKLKRGELFTIPVAGSYLVQVDTSEGTITKKVVVF